MLVYIEIEYNLAEKLQNKRDTKKGRIHLRLYKERVREDTIWLKSTT